MTPHWASVLAVAAPFAIAAAFWRHERRAARRAPVPAGDICDHMQAERTAWDHDCHCYYTIRDGWPVLIPCDPCRREHQDWTEWEADMAGGSGL